MLRFLFCFLFLAINPAQAERGLLFSVREAVSGLSHVNNLSAEVCKTRVCPAYISKFIEEDSKGSSMPERESPEEMCKIPEREHFKTAKDLEKGFQKSDLTTLSKIMPSIEASCLIKIDGKSQVQKDKRRSLVVAEYFYLMNRLKMGSAMLLDEVAAIDSILGKPLLSGVNCRQFNQFSRLEASCKTLKSDLNCKTQNKIPMLAKETIQALKARRILDREIRLNPSPKKRADIEAAVRVMNQKYTWITGSTFRKQCSAFKQCSEKQMIKAITEQLSEDRDKHLTNAYSIQAPVKCLQGQNGSEKNCEDLENTIESMPEFDTSLFDESRAEKELRSEIDRVICHRYERNRKNTINKIKKEVGINIGLSAISLGTGSLLRGTLLASRMKNLGTLSKAGLWTGALGMNLAYSTPALKEAKAECDKKLNISLDKEISGDPSQVSCPKDLSYGTGNAVHDHRGCMEAVTFAALNMLPFASSYFLKDGKQIVSAIARPVLTVGAPISRLASKVKKGAIKYARAVKATNGKRIITAPRVKTKPIFALSEGTGYVKGFFTIAYRVLDRAGRFTLNPIATVRNSKRQFSFPASMLTSLLVLDLPMAALEGKNLEKAYSMKDSIPGGNYAWDLVESGAVDSEEILGIFGDHDRNFNHWVDTGDDSKLPRLARLKSALNMTAAEFKAFNELTLSVYKDEFAVYKASSATGTNEEMALFNENIFKILSSKIHQSPALARFSVAEKELLNTAYFPILPIKETSEDDFSLSQALLIKNTPEMTKIQSLVPMGLSIGEALLMTNEALKGSSTEKINKAKRLLPPEFQSLASRPDIPIKDKVISLASPTTGKEIKLHDEIDRWKLFLTDQRFQVGLDLFKNNEVNEVEAMKYVEKIIPHYNELYDVINQSRKKPLTTEETQKVLKNPVMGSIAEEIEAAAEMNKWAPEVKAQKEKKAVTSWLEYHVKMANDQRPKTDEYQKRFEQILSN